MCAVVDVCRGGREGRGGADSECSKLTDWDDDDPSTLQDVSRKWDKVVTLKHMFTLQELEEDPAAMLEIKEDIREECAKLGDVTNVVLFDKEPQGVARVRFKDAQAAEACVKVSCGCRSTQRARLLMWW